MGRKRTVPQRRDAPSDPAGKAKQLQGSPVRDKIVLLLAVLMLIGLALLLVGKYEWVEAKEKARPHPPRDVGGLSLLATYTHDKGAFTQGLEVDGNDLIESTGLYAESTLRRVDPKTGKVKKSIRLESRYFGEGLTLIGNQIILLTWREQTGFFFDLETFERRRTFEYSSTTNEGWGICYDGKSHFIMSDGSANLHFWDTETLAETKRITVKDRKGRPQERLNELEYIPERDLILANVWYRNYILVISPKSGVVKKMLNFETLKLPQHAYQGEDCLNGIAYNRSSSELYLTGKKWKKVYKLGDLLDQI